VNLQTGSLARRAAGEERHPVRSWHHQGPDRIAEGVTVTGHSELDGTPEAIEVPGRRFALGVLWHPEEDEASRVIGALVDEARESAQARAA